MNALILYFLTLALSCDCGRSDFNLELVQVLFRHGARTPLQRSLDFFGITNTTIYDPSGIGVLTNVGKQQAYNLGLFLRNRYNDHLNVNYKAEDLYAYSSAEDRTKMTMQLVLAGLYPPKGSNIWNPSLSWTPVPFKFTPKELDILLRGYEIPKFLELLDEVHQSSEYKQRFQKLTDSLRFIDDKTGVKASANLSTLTYTFDILYANEYLNLTMPDWYTDDVRKALLEVQIQGYDDFVSTDRMKQIGIGLLVRTFVENMNLNKTQSNPRKMYLYSGHESDLALFTRVHNIPEFRYPHFGNSLIFEKWRDNNNKVYVKAFAWTGNEQLLNLKLGGYKNFCPIDDYLKIANPVMLADNEVENILREFNSNQLKNFFFQDTAVMQR